MTMSTSEVRISSKGQIVLPKSARERLGLKKGDKLKLQVDEEKKTILLQRSIAPPDELFVRVGTAVTSELLREGDQMDRKKERQLLKALGIE